MQKFVAFGVLLAACSSTAETTTTEASPTSTAVAAVTSLPFQPGERLVEDADLMNEFLTLAYGGDMESALELSATDALMPWGDPIASYFAFLAVQDVQVLNQVCEPSVAGARCMVHLSDYFSETLGYTYVVVWTVDIDFGLILEVIDFQPSDDAEVSGFLGWAETLYPDEFDAACGADDDVLCSEFVRDYVTEYAQSLEGP